MLLLSTVFFAVVHAYMRVLSNGGMHPYEIALFRCFFGLLVLAPWLAVRARGALRTRHVGMHAALNVVAMLMFITALGITPIAQVQALALTPPCSPRCWRYSRSARWWACGAGARWPSASSVRS